MGSNRDLRHYFEDDEEKALTRSAVTINEYKYDDNQITFSYSHYFEFFTIHILSFVILGPLINLYTLIFRKNKHLMFNLQFAPRNSISFYFQNFLWLISVYYYWVLFASNSDIKDINSLMLVCISYVIRACPIAGKYSTYPENKIKKIKEQPISYKEIESELMLIGWIQQKPNVVEKEIECTLLRQEIDDTLFKISFINPISQRAEKCFDKIVESHSDYYKSHSKTECRQCSADGKEIWYYDAKLVFEFLIQEFNKRDTTKKFWKLLVFATLSYLYGVSPGIIRAIYGQTFHGESVREIIGFYLNSLSMAFLMMSAIMFSISAKIDMKRRSFILRQLG